MKRILTFLAGMLTAAVISGLGVGALAASGQLTITVDPINILVNGETFQPKDAQGNAVPVFAYNGTTYAPLRALAEAYGLEVGYDAGAKMATVQDPDVAPVTAIPGEPLSLKSINIKLVQMDGKHYAIGSDESRGSTYYIAETETGTLLFTDDITVNTEGIQRKNESGEYESFPYCSSWLFNYILRLAIMDDYTVDTSKNPYVDGVLNVTSPNLYLGDYLMCGVEEKVYVSLAQSYTPMWVEYNGKRIERQQNRSDELTTVNGIRYIDGKICMNDVLSYFGIGKTVSVGKYEDTWYIEVA